MTVMDRVLHLISKLLLERPVRDTTLVELREDLEQAAQDAQGRLKMAHDTRENRETLRHVICIERWGRRRLQVALGEPLVIDESDRYLPPADTPWDELRQSFLETRRETLALVRRLEEANVGRDVTVPHNQWGELTVHGWLNYLKGHAHRDLRAVG